MNIEYLTPSMWDTLRKLDYYQLMKFREMMQPVDGEDY